MQDLNKLFLCFSFPITKGMFMGLLWRIFKDFEIRDRNSIPGSAFHRVTLSLLASSSVVVTVSLQGGLPWSLMQSIPSLDKDETVWSAAEIMLVHLWVCYRNCSFCLSQYVFWWKTTALSWTYSGNPVERPTWQDTETSIQKPARNWIKMNTISHLEIKRQ